MSRLPGTRVSRAITSRIASILASPKIWTYSRYLARLPSVSEQTAVDNDALLRRHGLHVTAQRLAVLRAVSHQAVYDVLRALTAAGLVRRIQPTGSVARYEARVGDNHHHLICRACEKMVDVDCAVGAAPCLTAAEDSGYEIDEAEVIYWGRCPECVTAASAASGG